MPSRRPCRGPHEGTAYATLFPARFKRGRGGQVVGAPGRKACISQEFRGVGADSCAFSSAAAEAGWSAARCGGSAARRASEPQDIVARVDMDDLAGDPGCEVAAEVEGGAGHILQGDVAAERRFLGRVSENAAEALDT